MSSVLWYHKEADLGLYLLFWVRLHFLSICWTDRDKTVVLQDHGLQKGTVSVNVCACLLGIHVRQCIDGFSDQESKQAEVWMCHWHLVYKLCHFTVFVREAANRNPGLLIFVATGGNPPTVLLIVRQRYTIQRRFVYVSPSNNLFVLALILMGIWVQTVPTAASISVCQCPFRVDGWKTAHLTLRHWNISNISFVLGRW